MYFVFGPINGFLRPFLPFLIIFGIIFDRPFFAIFTLFAIFGVCFCIIFCCDLSCASVFPLKVILGLLEEMSQGDVGQTNTLLAQGLCLSFHQTSSSGLITYIYSKLV